MMGAASGTSANRGGQSDRRLHLGLPASNMEGPDMAAELSVERLREVLTYDNETGVFTWKRRKARIGEDPAKVAAWNTRYAGKPAGVKTHGYIKIAIDDKKHYAHRLAHLFMTDEWPPVGKVIDHIDRDGLNNAWTNLRVASKRLNSKNAPAIPNPTGLTGVTQLPNGRWMAQCNYLGKHIYLGTWDTPEEAHAAYMRKQRQLPDHIQIEEKAHEQSAANA